MRAFLFGLVVLAASGCASHMSVRDEAPSEAEMPQSLDGVNGDKPPAQPATRASGFGLDRQVYDNEGRPVTDEEVGRLLDWRVALPKNARIALLEARSYREYYNCGWGEPDRRVEGAEWSAHPATPEDVDAVKGDLLASNRIESVTTVPSVFLPARADLGRCRYAAARANADLVLLYAKATREIRYRNKLANLYPLIVGLVLPGEETVVATRVEGALVDARTGRVFSVAQGSARGEDASSPLAASDEGRRILLDKTERDALVQLAKNLRADLDAATNRDAK